MTGPRAYAADELTMMFATRRTTLSYDIWEPSRPSKASSWDIPVSRDELDTSSNETQVAISDDGLRIIYVSSFGGTDFDLHEASRTSRAEPFTGLREMTELNTGFDEIAPALSSDEREIFFVSNRPGGVGMLDLWRAERSSRDVPFGQPVLVSEPSTARDEFGPILSADGTQLYLNHDTLVAGNGAADIAVATRSCR